MIENGLVLFVGADRIGRGDDALGAKLIPSFFSVLTGAERLPETIVFMNAGVRLVAEGAETLEFLRAVEAKGVRILCCGTCADWLAVKDRIRAGSISNMGEIQATLLGASRVVSL